MRWFGQPAEFELFFWTENNPLSADHPPSRRSPFLAEPPPPGQRTELTTGRWTVGVYRKLWLCDTCFKPPNQMSCCFCNATTVPKQHISRLLFKPNDPSGQNFPPTIWGGGWEFFLGGVPPLVGWMGRPPRGLKRSLPQWTEALPRVAGARVASGQRPAQ